MAAVFEKYVTGKDRELFVYDLEAHGGLEPVISYVHIAKLIKMSYIFSAPKSFVIYLTYPPYRSLITRKGIRSA